MKRSTRKSSVSTMIYTIVLFIAGLSVGDCALPFLQQIESGIEPILSYNSSAQGTPYLWKANEESPEVDMATPQIVRREGYPSEAHVVQTEDGYLLTMHRIPAPLGSPVVFLQHGFIESSSDWVITGKKNGLAFILADQGYDVWMGNARGNTYSRSHVDYLTSDIRFWDFSWSEMAVYDLPAEIAYVTKLTNQNVTYIGHSMGTTMFFAMAIDRPDTASKVKAMFALAPVAYLGHARTPLALLSPFTRNLGLIIRFLGRGEFLPQNEIVRILANGGCNSPVVGSQICSNALFFVCGFDPDQFDYTLLPMITSHSPAGTSTKTLVHYSQEIQAGRFQRYDYGPRGNLRMYNSIVPPAYDVSKIQVPIGLLWAENDWLASPIDVKTLSDQIPRKILNYKVPLPSFNHLDFLWAIDAPKLVYKRLLMAMRAYQ